MALAIHPDDSKIDLRVTCSDCAAVCCRLTVVLDEADRVAEHFITRGANGVDTMAHDSDGWCVALDRVNQCCGIYEQRPTVCRKFAMGGGYCRFERAKFADASPRPRITLRVV